MVRLLHVFLLIVLALSVLLPVSAQPSLSFQHYSTADGLSDNRVTCITKDHEGFMWMGTWAGVNRFDGKNFVTFKATPGDGSELGTNRLDRILADDEGFLWLQAYDKKVYRFDKQTEQFLSVSKFLEAKSSMRVDVDQIVVLRNKLIAVISKDQGIFFVSMVNADKPLVTWASSHPNADYRLPSNRIHTFYQDNAKKIWVASNLGLICLQEDSTRLYKKDGLQDDLMTASVTSITENGDFIWFGAEGGRLFMLKKTDDQLSSIDLKAGRINDLKISRDGTSLFCSTAKGRLVTIRTASLEINSVANFDNGTLLSIYEDRRGLLWIEPGDVGVLMFDPATRSFKHFKQENYSSYHLDASEYDLFEDQKGTVYVRMKGCGFGYFDSTTKRFNYFYNERDSKDYRFSNLTKALFYDSDGILWLSTDDGGIEKITLPQNEFTHEKLTKNSELKEENEVRGLWTDSNGRLWVCDKTGKVYLLKDGAVIKTLVLDNPSYASGVYTILQDRKKNIWLGTKGNGLFKLEQVGPQADNYKITHFVHDDEDLYSISSNVVYSLIEDSDARVWVGTFGGGINLIDQSGTKPRFYHQKNTFAKYPSGGCNRVRSLVLDATGKIWIGTTDGLLIFDPNQPDLNNTDFTQYVKLPLDDESLGNNDVQYMYRDKNDVMWVLTSSGGLNKGVGKNPMESLKFSNYTKKDGLPSDYLLSCLEDAAGYLWIATQNGLSRFDKVNGYFQNYNSTDGLNAGGFSEASCTWTANGELVFGMLNGYMHFNPGKIIQNKIKSNIVFTNLQINNEDVFPATENSVLKSPINHTKEIILNYDQNILSIDYRLLDYRSQDKISYEYRLLGFHPDWRSNKGETKASFTNLSPGTYRFEVRSANPNLYSNVPIKAVDILILPPPWKTWWAYGIYALVGLSILWVVRKYALMILRLRQRIIIERKLADLKLNFFTNVSHELRTPLTLILNPLEEISRTENLSDRGARHLTVVRKNAKRMSRFINQLLDLRKAQSGKAVLNVSMVELVSFVKRIIGYFADVAERRQITIAIETEVSALFAWIDAEKIDIVVYNVLANAVKFTPDGKHIRILLERRPTGVIIIKIIDEGKGVPDSQMDEIFRLYFGGQPSEDHAFRGTGIGLALSKELIQLHHGKISGSNNVPHGLIVTIELMAGRDHFIKDNTIFVDPSYEVEPTPIEFITPDEFIPEPELKTTDDELPLLLLVEDNRDLRSFLRDQLRHIYRVESAENGMEGLQKANQLLPDVVLSDVMMPVMDGIAMLDRLKNNRDTSHIPVVLLSAKFSVESQIEGLRYGADHYLAKPFRNDFLVATLTNIVAQRKRLFNFILQRKNTVDIRCTEIEITSHDELFLKKVINIVEEKMKEPQFSIDTVVGSMNMSRSPFYKKLKSLSGLSPVEFVKEIRLKRSLQYLDAGEQNISTIAFEVGFKSAKYFSTCFRQRFNESPTEYLKSKMHVHTDH